MDDFDAPAALAACMVLREALESCKAADNVAAVVRAALSGFEAALPDWAFDPEEQPRLWKHIAVRKELRKQLQLVEQIGALDQLDGAVLKKLRSTLTSAELRGETSLPSQASAGPVAITNQQAFEQYRSMVELDLRTQGPLDLPGVAFAMLRIGAWSGRYSRRRQTIDGSYGRLADAFAPPALLARQQARDAAVKGTADWGPEAEEMIGWSFANPMNLFGVQYPHEPHGYGPSLRQLWIEAKRAGRSDLEAWESIVAWTRHRPAAWTVEDLRKRKGHAFTTPELGEQLAQELLWTATGDVEHPWAVEVAGYSWRVRLNDFPDDFMYSLLIGDAEVGSFHDWPETWQR
jgi:hypothetical protein